VRQRFQQLKVLLRLALLLWSAACLSTASADQQQLLVRFGQQLFFDVNLSATRNQSCASCHNPAYAYADPGADLTGGTVSVGADGVSLGTRNAPSLTYVAAAPAFQRLQSAEGGHAWLGGYFLDGRAATLKAQTLQPILDPGEMAMPDQQTLASRIRENPVYLKILQQLDPAITRDNNSEALVSAAVNALVAFESSPEFFAYDSRYDRSLRGEYTMTADEAIGRELFFSDLTNCRHCHLLDTSSISPTEVFTSFRYYNIGTPPNFALQRNNGNAGLLLDPGLAGNPAVQADPMERGKFRVPGLRNVAVTAPYMHNGVFSELETAVAFYGRHLASNNITDYNPETGNPWQGAEIPETVETDLLNRGQPLDAIRVRQLVAFLKTLTDQRYEHLLQPR
jgi:cytochrome c peroxidase